MPSTGSRDLRDDDRAGIDTLDVYEQCSLHMIERASWDLWDRRIVELSAGGRGCGRRRRLTSS